MPDITGILSTFKKELFSGRYMIVIFIWLVALVILPDDVKIFVNQKIEIPYSYQLLIFSISVLSYSLFNVIAKKLKAFFRLKRIRAIEDEIEQEEEQEISEIVNLVVSLPKKERDIVEYLLHSGYPSISYDEIPNIHTQRLISKQIIKQIGFPSGFRPSWVYCLNPKVEHILREQIRIQLTENE